MKPAGVHNDRQMFEAAMARGDVGAAEAACRRMLAGRRKEPNAMRFLGQLAVQRGQFKEAELLLRGCLKLQPRNAAVHVALAQMLHLQGQVDAALAQLDKALRLQPGLNEAIIAKANVLERTGDYEAAATLAQKVSTPPERTPALALLQCTLALHTNEYQRAVDLSESHWKNSRLPSGFRRQISLMRGQAYDMLGDADRAMEAWTQAHALLRRPFDPDAYARTVDAELAYFTRERVARLPWAENDTESPVFIAGMARSGTTLVEQILDAHPDVVGGGELTEIEAMPRTIPQEIGSHQPYPVCLDDLTQADATRLAEGYLKRLADIGGPTALRVVNKSVLNYRYLGLVQLLFPKARVIHIRRHPMDTCLSIFMSPLNPDNHPYGSNLRHLGLVHRQADRLMEHWKSVLDLPILDISYEEIVENQDAQSRRLIDFCGLPWNDACCHAHKSGRTVTTLSYHQVSQPIYTSAMNRYKRYEHLLGPLADALEEPS